MPGYDHDALFDRINRLVKSDKPAASAMRELIAYCGEAVPHDDWAAFEGLAYDEDIDRLETWLGGLLATEAPGDGIDGLWFGLFNPTDGRGQPTAGLYAAGGRYDPSNPDWMCDLPWWPKGRYARSRALGDIYRLAYRKGEKGLGNAAEYPLCLAFAGLAVRILAERLGDSLRGKTARRGLTVGFDSGDWLCVGSLTEAGLVPSKDSQTLDPWPTG